MPISPLRLRVGLARAGVEPYHDLVCGTRPDALLVPVATRCGALLAGQTRS